MAQALALAKKEFPWVWEGTDRKGNRLKGRSLAVNENEVRAELRRQGVIPVRIRRERKLFSSGKKITPLDIAIFSRQLATMLTSSSKKFWMSTSSTQPPPIRINPSRRSWSAW